LAVQEITQGEGATHILEVGGKDTYERSTQYIAANGTIAQIGVLTLFRLLSIWPSNVILLSW
jgi:NADPH:quinone reductase-like Zn-dependent oxidoreductase